MHKMCWSKVGWALVALLCFICPAFVKAQITTYRVLDNNLNNIHNTYISFSPLEVKASAAVPYNYWSAYCFDLGHKMGRLGSIKLHYSRVFSVATPQNTFGVSSYGQYGGIATYTFQTRIELTEKRINLKDENVKVPYVKIHGKYVRQFEVRGGFYSGRNALTSDGLVEMRYGFLRMGYQYVVTDRLKAMSRFGMKRFLKQKAYYADIAYAPLLRAEGDETASKYRKMRFGLIGGLQVQSLRTVGVSWTLEGGVCPSVMGDAATFGAFFAQVKLGLPLLSFRLPTPRELLYEMK